MINDCDHVIPTYNEIISCQQGGITLTKVVLYKIFFMSHKVVHALKNFFKIFENKSLTQIQGKEIVIITKQVYAAVVSMKSMEMFTEVSSSVIIKTFRQSSSIFLLRGE